MPVTVSIIVICIGIILLESCFTNISIILAKLIGLHGMLKVIRQVVLLPSTKLSGLKENLEKFILLQCHLWNKLTKLYYVLFKVLNSELWRQYLKLVELLRSDSVLFKRACTRNWTKSDNTSIRQLEYQ